jgi:hypothetical protein
MLNYTKRTTDEFELIIIKIIIIIRIDVIRLYLNVNKHNYLPIRFETLK